MIYLDTETYSLNTLPITIQYAIDDGNIEIMNLWYETPKTIMALIEMFCEHEICAYNLTFDWFMLVKLYNICKQIEPYEMLLDQFDAINQTFQTDWFLRPQGALDIMLEFRKTHFQDLMARKRPTIYKIPGSMVDDVILILNECFSDIQIGDKKEFWKISDGDIDGFVNVYFAWKPGLPLKRLIRKIYGEGTIDLDMYWEDEGGYCHWENRMEKHKLERSIDHWMFNDIAIQYAKNDIQYLRNLKADFNLQCGHYDNELAIMAANVKCKGFAIDIDEVQRQYDQYNNDKRLAPTAPRAVLEYVTEPMEELDAVMIQDTKALTLQNIAKLMDGEPAERAKLVIKARKAQSRCKLMEKLLHAKRFYPEFRICGTLTNRMSGGGKINPQGIAREETIRKIFTFNDKSDNYVLSGGDADVFEISIAQAVHKDKQMDIDLTNGYKIPVFLAAEAFGKSYDEVVATKGSQNDLYVLGKNGTYALFYGGNAHTLTFRMGVKESIATTIEKKFHIRYDGFAKNRAEIMEDFTTHEDREEFRRNYVASLLGHRRYFTLEEKIIKEYKEALQEIDNLNDGIMVIRTTNKGKQTAKNATISALWGAIYGMQSRCGRQAVNHVVQSTGAELMKMLQAEIWALQLYGVSKPVVMPMNIHDEILCYNSVPADVDGIVKTYVSETRKLIKHFGITWKQEMSSWIDTH